MIQDKINIFIQDYQENQSRVMNQGDWEASEVFDTRRFQALTPLSQMIENFLLGRTSILQFKEESEKLCRVYPYWGFKGMSGQMQLNQYVNNIQDSKKTSVLQEAIRVPQTMEEAKEKLNSLARYIQRFKDVATNRKSIPRVSQISMLSYFWELQSHVQWSAYYGSSEKVINELGYYALDTTLSPGEKYVMYMKVIDELISITKGMVIMLGSYPRWYIEHILWYQFIKQSGNEQINKDKEVIQKRELNHEGVATNKNEWIPSIIDDLEQIAKNEETVWTKYHDIRPEKAFETKLRYAFTILGFEVSELGQGTGRQPDGIARSIGMQEKGDYAIIYDAKARKDMYRLGTQDREIQEYIKKKVNELKHQRIYRQYFCIISSQFDESADIQAALLEIYKTTRVPIVLLKAVDLLLIVDTTLQHVEIDQTSLENLFLQTGILTREKIISELGV